MWMRACWWMTRHNEPWQVSTKEFFYYLLLCKLYMWFSFSPSHGATWCKKEQINLEYENSKICDVSRSCLKTLSLGVMASVGCPSVFSTEEFCGNNPRWQVREHDRRKTVVKQAQQKRVLCWLVLPFNLDEASRQNYSFQTTAPSNILALSFWHSLNTSMLGWKAIGFHALRIESLRCWDWIIAGGSTSAWSSLFRGHSLFLWVYLHLL